MKKKGQVFARILVRLMCRSWRACVRVCTRTIPHPMLSNPKALKTGSSFVLVTHCIDGKRRCERMRAIYCLPLYPPGDPQAFRVRHCHAFCYRALPQAPCNLLHIQILNNSDFWPQWFWISDHESSLCL